MEMIVENTPAILLKLNKEEAEWLMAFVQNHPDDEGTEPNREQTMREELFILIKATLQELN